MIEVAGTDRGLRVVDTAGGEVAIQLEGWEPGSETVGVGRPVDAVETGSVVGITAPARGVTIESAGRSRYRTVVAGERISVPTGDHVVRIDDDVVVYVGLRSGFAIRRDGSERRVSIDPGGPTPVALGFRSRDDFPTDELRIPPTPDGVAAAITAAGGFHRTGTPDRSYPAMRRHPPAVELDPDARPADVEDAHGGSDRRVVFRLSPSLGTILSASSLAYYLGAAIEVDDRDDPVLVAGGTEHRFSGPAAFPDEVAAILARVFYLDCLIRNVGPFGFDLQECDLLEELPLDPRRTYSMPIADRLAEYLAAPFERVASELPEWPLATSVAPTVDNARAIPYLLDRLSLVFPPDATVLDDRTIVERSLDDFCRSSTVGAAPPPVEPRALLEPRSRRGAVHGWMAEGATVDAFKCTPEAFSNRRDFLDRGAPLSVAVVSNDDAMDGEFTGVIDAYQKRSSASSVDLDVRVDLSTAELAATFLRRYDVLHYIGHCDRQGLRCRDGHVSTTDLPASNVGAFFLNACDSYDQGLGLVRRGSVGGAVTLGDVLDEQARKVGTAFARLLTNGYSLYRSLRLSRARAIMNRHYAVVGDGTFVPARDVDTSPSLLLVTPGRHGGYRLQWEVQSGGSHGDVCRSQTGSRPLLAGNHDVHDVTERQFVDVLGADDFPVIYGDELRWSPDLLEELS